MATSGLDGQMKIWDLRNYKHLNAYYTPTPATSLDISQSGLLGVGFGPHIQVYSVGWSNCRCVHVLIPEGYDRFIVSIVSRLEGTRFCASQQPHYMYRFKTE